MNSGQFNGLDIQSFKAQIIDWLEEQGKGTRKVNYKLRDWLFSRVNVIGVNLFQLFIRKTVKYCL